MSLMTLLTMFELERRTGCLTLHSATEHIRLYLQEGKLTASLLNGSSMDPVGCLREALTWVDASFEFAARAIRRGDVEPCSIGALLIEASHPASEDRPSRTE